MRLDLVLKQSGLIKRRVVAKALADNGKVLINDKNAKPSAEVSDDDILTLHLGQKVLKVKITFVQKGKRLIPNYEQLL